VRRSVSTKERFLKVVAVRQAIAHSIQAGDSYLRARSEGQANRFAKAMQVLEDARDREAFNSWFLFHDDAEARNKYNDTDLQGHYTKFCDLDSAISGLEREHQRFNKMHAANTCE